MVDVIHRQNGEFAKYGHGWYEVPASRLVYKLDLYALLTGGSAVSAAPGQSHLINARGLCPTQRLSKVPRLSSRHNSCTFPFVARSCTGVACWPNEILEGVFHIAR